jgi:hypothetical protein
MHRNTFYTLFPNITYLGVSGSILQQLCEEMENPMYETIETLHILEETDGREDEINQIPSFASYFPHVEHLVLNQCGEVYIDAIMDCKQLKVVDILCEQILSIQQPSKPFLSNVEQIRFGSNYLFSGPCLLWKPSIQVCICSIQHIQPILNGNDVSNVKEWIFTDGIFTKEDIELFEEKTRNVSNLLIPSTNIYSNYPKNCDKIVWHTILTLFPQEKEWIKTEQEKTKIQMYGLENYEL